MAVVKVAIAVLVVVRDIGILRICHVLIGSWASVMFVVVVVVVVLAKALYV